MYPDMLNLLISGIILILIIPYYLARPYLLTLTKIIIPKNKIGQLFSKRQERLIAILTIGLDLSLVITFKIFSEVIPQLDCLTLGEILVSAIVAIASLSSTLIPLIYLLSKPIKIFSKYRKYQPNLIQP